MPHWMRALLTTGAVTALVACSSNGADPAKTETGAQAGSDAGSGGAMSAAGTSSVAGTGGSDVPATAGTNAAGASGSATGGSAGDGLGGTAGNSSAGSGGATTTGGTGVDANGDTLPTRPLSVTATAGRHEHTFRSKDADSTVTFNDNTQIAVVDNRAAKMMGKLVLPFQGAGVKAGVVGPNGQFCAARGFHVLAIAAFQDYTITLNDADFYGDARKQVWDGLEHTKKGDFSDISMTPADGVAQRTQKALQFLHKQYPTEDWGYYLNADGSVRWSDIILTGMSHGASNVARWAMLVRVSRVVSLSGPRDNMCTSMNASNCGGVVAKWFSETPATPIDRFYALTGVNDEQHLQHLFAMETLKYVGKATSVADAQPPYGNSHRLTVNEGHDDYCDQATYKAACNYAFGVPTENQNGVQ